MSADLWFTSDTHFGHEAVIRHSRRPYDTPDEMNEAIVAAWNAVVGERDDVWHLGDVAFIGATAGEWVPRLNGRLHVLFGNHDSEKEIRGLAESGAIAWCGDVRYLRHNRQRYWLSHYAHRAWPNSGKGAFHLYGHSHGDMPGVGRSMDVGIDVALRETGQPRPFHVTEIVEALGGRPAIDHHHTVVRLRLRPRRPGKPPAGRDGAGQSTTYTQGRLKR